MVKDLNVFPFDNDMKLAHFGTKLCIYHEKTVSVYQRNTIFTVYFKKSGNLKFSYKHKKYDLMWLNSCKSIIYICLINITKVKLS